MQGLAGSITPTATGSVLIAISGIIETTTTTIGDGISYLIAYGTGTAPTNGAANAGTNPGPQQAYIIPGTITPADLFVPFCVCAVVTGLAIGTAYWIDLAARSFGDVTAVFLRNVSISIIEVG